MRYDAIRQGRCGLAADGMAGRCKARIGLVRQGPARQVGRVAVSHVMATKGWARQFWFGERWRGTAGRGLGRRGRLGKARCVEFRLFRVGSGEDRQVRFEVARQRGARWGDERNGLVRQGRCGLVSNGDACRGFSRNGLAGLV